jgi:repressor LexA
MRSNAPTPKQRAVLEYLRRTVRHLGRPPSQLEMKAHFGFRSATSVSDNLKALARKGLIQWKRGAARSIVFPDGPDAEDGHRLSIVGEVPAGLPAEAVPWSDEYIVIGKHSFPRPEELFALRVRGQSMTGAGILDQDLLIVRRAVEATHMQIVVARVDGDVTVKRLMRERGTVYLHAENPDFNDYHFSPEQEVVIEGVGVGVFREL